MVDSATGVLRYAPNLPWRELPLRDRLTEATGLPCVVDNDGNAAAWGEYRFGTGRGSTDMLLVTVGTGIGGGIVSGGRLFRGATAYPRGRGVWRDDERGGALTHEEPVIVFAYVAEASMTKTALAELYRTLSRMGRETNQGEVGVVIDGKYYGITQYQEDQP